MKREIKTACYVVSPWSPIFETDDGRRFDLDAKCGIDLCVTQEIEEFHPAAYSIEPPFSYAGPSWLRVQAHSRLEIPAFTPGRIHFRDPQAGTGFVTRRVAEIYLPYRRRHPRHQGERMFYGFISSFHEIIKAMYDAGAFPAAPEASIGDLLSIALPPWLEGWAAEEYGRQYHWTAAEDIPEPVYLPQITP